MQIAYLGLFSRVLDWVMSKIFQPVFDFISWLLGEVFTWLFNNVLSPIIEWALKSVIPVLIDAIMAMFAEILYKIMAAFLRIVDYIEVAFDIFIGVREVTYTTVGSLSPQSDSLLDAMFAIAPVRQAMLMVTVMAAGVSILFAMYAAIKSMGDLEGRKPIGSVLKSCGKAALHFMLVPTMVVFLLEIAAIILKQTCMALGADSSPSLGTIVFLISALGAAKTAPANPSFSVAPFSDYYSGKYQYHDAVQVMADFDLTKLDFLVGIGAGLFIFIMLAIVLLVFVQRLFDIIVLYIISPLFSATIPLDDGDKFSRWRDMFIGKVFSGFGAVVAMRVYLLLIPMFMDNSIDFTASGANAVSGAMNYVIRLMFVLGGAMAVQKSSSMITSLINTSAGMQEQSMSDMASGAIYGYTVGKATNLAYRGAAKAAAGIGSKIAGVGAASKMKNISKFEGGSSSAGSGSKLPGSSGSVGAGKKGPSGRAVGDGQYVKRGIATGAGFDMRGFKFRKEISGGTSGYRITEGRMSLAKQQLRVKRGEDGKLHFDKAKILGMHIKRGEDGKVHLSKVNTLPGFTFSRMSNGEMKLTRFRSTQMKYRIDAEGKAVKDSTLLFGRKAITHSQSGADFVAGLERDGKHMDIGTQNRLLREMGSDTRVQGPQLPRNPKEYIEANPKSSVAEQNEVLSRLGYQTRVSGPDLMPTKGVDADTFVKNLQESSPGISAEAQNKILRAHGYEERFSGPDLPKTSSEYFEANPIDQSRDLSGANAIRSRIGEDIAAGPSVAPTKGMDASSFTSILYDKQPGMRLEEQNQILSAHGFEERYSGPDLPRTSAEYFEANPLNESHDLGRQNEIRARLGEDIIHGPNLPSDGSEYFAANPASSLAEENRFRASLGYDDVSGPELPSTSAEYFEANPIDQSIDLSGANAIRSRIGEDLVHGPSIPTPPPAPKAPPIVPPAPKAPPIIPPTPKAPPLDLPGQSSSELPD